MATDTSTGESTRVARLHPAAFTLASLWILLPAVQYIGSIRRTEVAVARETPHDSLSRLDLTPWYIILVGLTLVYALLRIMNRRSLNPFEAQGGAD